MDLSHYWLNHITLSIEIRLNEKYTQVHLTVKMKD